MSRVRKKIATIRREQFKKTHARLAKKQRRQEELLKRERRLAETEAGTEKASSEIAEIRQKRFQRRTAGVRKVGGAIIDEVNYFQKQQKKTGKPFDPLASLTGTPSRSGATYDPLTGARMGSAPRKRRKSTKRKTTKRRKSTKRKGKTITIHI